MLPSREKALAGLTYTARDEEEYKAEQAEKQRLEKAKVEVELWQMQAGKVTQLRIKYKGEYGIVCVRDDAPTNEPEKLKQVVEDFYNYIDLSKTALIKKATTSSKVSVSATVEKTTVKTKSTASGYKRSHSDDGLEKIGISYNNAVYKERVIQILAYAKKRMTDESIPERDRPTFTTRDIIDDVFNDIYGKTSPATIKNKAASTLKFMVDKGWLKFSGIGKNKIAIYEVVTNPYESEMPMQAEPIDSQYLAKAKTLELQTYREG